MGEMTEAEIIATVEANIRQGKLMLGMMVDELEADLVPYELRLLIKANELLLSRLKARPALKNQEG